MTCSTRTILALALCAGMALAEHASNGTWKINAAKSKSNVPRTGSDTITVSTEGDAVTFGSTRYIRDGKEHPYEGTPKRFDTYVMKAPNDRETSSVYKKGGKAMRTVKTKVSKDGKVWTSVAKGVDENGKPYETINVYDRQ